MRKQKRRGKVCVPETLLAVMLGYEDAQIISAVVSHERDYIEFVIEHPEMPLCNEGDTYVGVTYDFKREYKWGKGEL